MNSAAGPWSPNSIAASADTTAGAVYAKCVPPPLRSMKARFDAPYTAAVTNSSAVRSPASAARSIAPFSSMASMAARPQRHSRVARRNRSPSTAGRPRGTTSRPPAATRASAGMAPGPLPHPDTNPTARMAGARIPVPVRAVATAVVKPTPE